MYALKIVTTTLNIIMMSIIFFFMRGLKWKDDKESVIGLTAIRKQ